MTWSCIAVIIIIIIIIIIMTMATIATQTVQLATSHGNDIIQHKFLSDETKHGTSPPPPATQLAQHVPPVEQPQVRGGRGGGKTCAPLKYQGRGTPPGNSVD
jgi:hypothetical protein